MPVPLVGTHSPVGSPYGEGRSAGAVGGHREGRMIDLGAINQAVGLDGAGDGRGCASTGSGFRPQWLEIQQAGLSGDDRTVRMDRNNNSESQNTDLQ